MMFDTKHEFATNSVALFLVLSINNSRGRCVFMAQMVDRRKNKKPQIANATCDTMATVQSCPDCAGFANETVPFVTLIFLTRDKFLENAPSFLGFRRASYRGTVCGHYDIFFREGALRASSPWRPHRFNRITSLGRDVRDLKVCKVQQC